MKKILFIFLLIPFFLYSQNPDEWQTYFEKTNFFGSPTYDEATQYFKKMSDFSENAKFVTLGISPQGREINALIATKGNTFTPELARKANKPIILVENAIHSGEIEGLDATMLLLREILITKEKEDLLNKVVFIVIPIFSVDGHSRRSPYNRINQNGPTEMGWRVTANNLNLNRDFAKADSPEMQAWLKFYNEWKPNLFIDVHTTDGADYQYTITYGATKHKNIMDCQNKWIRKTFEPYINKKIDEAGFLVAPYSYPLDNDFTKGIADWVASPRYSHGYAAVQNRLGVLIETHMLKPYKARVFSTKAMLEGILELYNLKADEIIDLQNKSDEILLDKYSTEKFYPTSFTCLNSKGEDFIWKGFKSEKKFGKIANEDYTSYTNEKIDIPTKYFTKSEITDSVQIPKFYVIPQEWENIVEILKLHGVEIEVCKEENTIDAVRTKFSNVKFPSVPYEGRFSPNFDFTEFNEKTDIRKGDFIIPTNQKAIGIIIHTLEPKVRDSFVKWGFFNIIFERKEYFEMYSMEPIAQKMAEENPKLYKEFLAKVQSDEEFAKNGRARLNFFYENSPYYDKKHNIYPIFKVMK